MRAISRQLFSFKGGGLVQNFRDLKVWSKAHALTLLARDLRMLKTALYDELDANTKEVKRMLSALISRLKS